MEKISIHTCDSGLTISGISENQLQELMNMGIVWYWPNLNKNVFFDSDTQKVYEYLDIKL